MKHPHSPYPHALKDTTKKPGLLKRFICWVCDQVINIWEATPFIECRPWSEPDMTTVGDIIIFVVVMVGIPGVLMYISDLAP